MQNYKRFLLFILVFAAAIALCGCIPITTTEYYEFSPEEVTSIQFINNDDTQDPGDSILPDPFYTVPETQKADFLSDFSKVQFSDTKLIVLAAVDPSFQYGDQVVRINFTNGQYTFYSTAGYSETFDAAGEYVSSSHYSCEEEAMESLINKYYTAET